MRVKKEPKPVEITCIDCGVVFIAYSNKALRCEKCRKIAKRKTNAQWMAKSRNGVNLIYPKMTIREVLRELEIYNKENGTHLSYGQFIAIMGKGA